MLKVDIKATLGPIMYQNVMIFRFAIQILNLREINSRDVKTSKIVLLTIFGTDLESRLVKIDFT